MKLLSRWRSTPEPVTMSAIKRCELAAADPDVISLAQGIPYFDTPDSIKQAVGRAIADGRAAPYSPPQGLPELRRLVAAELQRDGMNYDSDREILITCGAAEGLAASLRAAVTDRRREVVVLAPSYAGYPAMIRAAGGQVRYVDLKATDQGWQLDLSRLARAVGRKTAAIVVCNPNNPTGHIFEPETLRSIGESARAAGCLLILDEVYKDFVYDRPDWYSLAEDERFREQIVRVFSFSKAYAMTGWRVAYLHADAAVVNRIVGVHDALVTCAPVVSQYAAIAALQQAATERDRFRAELADRRQEVTSWLDRLGDHFECITPAAAYFVFPRIKGVADDAAWVDRLIAEAGVAVVPGSAFGPAGRGHVRICFGRRPSEVSEACRRIESFVAKDPGALPLPQPAGSR